MHREKSIIWLYGLKEGQQKSHLMRQLHSILFQWAVKNLLVAKLQNKAIRLSGMMRCGYARNGQSQFCKSCFNKLAYCMRGGVKTVDKRKVA